MLNGVGGWLQENMDCNGLVCRVDERVMLDGKLKLNVKSRDSETRIQVKPENLALVAA